LKIDHLEEGSFRDPRAEKPKAALGGRFQVRIRGKFRFLPLLSEYQVQVGLLPNLGGYFGGEMLLYQQLLL
jgi:hypothetical protein